MAGISGIKVADELKDIVNSIFDPKSELDWGVFNIEGDSVLQVDYLGDDWFISKEDLKNDWGDFLDNLPQSSARYAVVNFPYVSPNDNILREKRIFIMWVPEYTTQKEKLMTTMYSRAVQDKLSGGSGFPISIQANEISDLTYNRILEKIKASCYCF